MRADRAPEQQDHVFGGNKRAPRAAGKISNERGRRGPGEDELKRTIERKEREIKSSELAATASAERSEAENDRLRGKVDMLEEQLRVQDEALEEVRHSGSDARNALEEELAALKEKMAKHAQEEDAKIQEAVQSARLDSEARDVAEKEAPKGVRVLRAMSETREMTQRVQSSKTLCRRGTIRRAQELAKTTAANSSEMEGEITRPLRRMIACAGVGPGVVLGSPRRGTQWWPVRTVEQSKLRQKMEAECAQPCSFETEAAATSR